LQTELQTEGTIHVSAKYHLYDIVFHCVNVVVTASIVLKLEIHRLYKSLQNYFN